MRFDKDGMIWNMVYKNISLKIIVLKLKELLDIEKLKHYVTVCRYRRCTGQTLALLNQNLVHGAYALFV